MQYDKPLFDVIKQRNRYGQEYWSARQLAQALDYASYRQFTPVLKKAKLACRNSGYAVNDHFEDGLEVITTKSGFKRKAATIFLSRYACYLAIQSANPIKEIVAKSQTYLALQTRKQELENSEESSQLSAEDQSRLLLRSEMTRHNKELAKAAKQAGVIEADEFSAFQRLGYQGLYGGLDPRQLHERKGLKKSQRILDHMGSTELAANLFRATQTEEKLKRDKIQGKELAYYLHHAVGRKVRETIKELGGVMPEELPPAKVSIKAIERKQIKSVTDNPLTRK